MQSLCFMLSMVSPESPQSPIRRSSTWHRSHRTSSATRSRDRHRWCSIVGEPERYQATNLSGVVDLVFGPSAIALTEPGDLTSVHQSLFLLYPPQSPTAPRTFFPANCKIWKANQTHERSVSQLERMVSFVLSQSCRRSVSP